MAKKMQLAETTATTELAKAEDLLPPEVDFDELLENLAEMDEVEFPRIRHKNGRFYFSDDPADKGVEEFVGVIFYYGKQNTYWAGTYDPKNIAPPDCFSVDGVTGSKARDDNGNFGTCQDCRLNQFGSGQGRGKACRNQVKLYIHRLGTTVPMTLFLAPTTIRNFENNYILGKVVQKGLSFAKIVTKFVSYQVPAETHYRVNFEIVSSYKGADADAVKKLRDYWLRAIKKDRTRLDIPSNDSQDGGNSGASESKNTRTVEPRPAPASAPSTPSPVPAMQEDDEDLPF
ncbi:hypothetical protein C4588_00665 [Candidatus Parcubacteria bacterium]|nr:MAG: hypothetical protein C4588_00665 [Candidatus Parcubacteria bacterium]